MRRAKIWMKSPVGVGPVGAVLLKRVIAAGPTLKRDNNWLSSDYPPPP